VNPSAQLLVFVTMFAGDQTGGIQAFHLDPAKGTLVPAAVTRDCPNGFFLTLSPDRRTLYSLTAKKFGEADTEEVIAWRIADRAGTLEPLGRRPAKGPASCYTATDPSGRTLLIAHYNGATVAVLPLAADGSLAGDPVALRHEGKGADPGRQEGPHPHAIIPAPAAEGRPRFAYAADLGADAIFVYRLDAAAGRLVANDPPLVKTKPGAGPRHLAFHPDGRRLYAINELDNTVVAYDFDSATGRLVERQVISTLPPDFQKIRPKNFKGKTYTADLKITPDGRFLYGTNRGHDSIAAYTIAPDGLLTLVEIVPSGGGGPQNLAITPDGSLLLCANMPGDNLAVFRIDRESGKLALVGAPATVKMPSCIAIVP
jgi:6-phosphogluconolactonase